jgi:hypothetical protein
MIQSITTCPLGSHCERVVDNVVERCAWYTTLAGKNPQTGKAMEPTSKCAMAWIPILLIEGNGKTDEVSASVIEVRETMLKQEPIKFMLNAIANEKRDVKDVTSFTELPSRVD